MLVMCAFDYNAAHTSFALYLHGGVDVQTKNALVQLEERTARLTILIDPRKKAVFERLCAEEDLTTSQVVRRLIRTYIEERLGRPWNPNEEPSAGGSPAPRGGTKRRSSRT
jgi:hypothetical protein